MENGFVRKKCIVCGEPIVGVTPRRKNGEPVCRKCTFHDVSPQSRLQTDSTIERKDQRVKVTPGGRRNRFLRAFSIFLAVGFGLAAVNLVSSAAFRDEPLRQGAVKTDRVGDECVKNLWALSKAMQEGRLPVLALACPASDRPYSVLEVNGETVITCPTPEAHKVTVLEVSRSSPIPVAVR